MVGTAHDKSEENDLLLKPARTEGATNNSEVKLSWQSKKLKQITSFSVL